MKLRGYLIVGGLTLFWVTPAAAEPLWENAVAGMTRATVKSLQPEAQEGERPSCALKIPARMIAGHSMEVCFGFIRDRDELNSVSLKQSGDASAYESLRRALTAKYGEPGEERCSRLIQDCSMTWISGATAIKLSRFEGGVTYVTYQAINNAGL